MMSEHAGKGTPGSESASCAGPASSPIHPAWRELMRLCERMGYGEIERLKIHDGLPVLAEVTRQKVRLIPP